MAELDEFDSLLNSELEKLERDIEALSRKEPPQRTMAIKKCQANQKTI